MLPGFTGFAGGLGSQPDARALLLENKGAVAIANAAIANRISGLRPRVGVCGFDEDGEETFTPQPTHRLQATLDRPNEFMTGRVMRMVMAYHLELVGATFWLKVSDGLELTSELWPLDPSRMQPLSGTDSPIAVWRYQPEGGSEQRYLPEDVVWIYRPDPAAVWSPMGTLGPQAVGYDALSFSGEATRAHFKNNAIPNAVLEASKDAEILKKGTKAYEGFKRDWRRVNHRRAGTDIGLPAILPPGFAVSVLQGALADLDAMTSWDREQFDRILMAAGVPPSIVGRVDDVNRAAAESSQWNFDTHTITPRTELIEDGLTVQVARDFDPNLCVRFPEFISKDKEFELQRRESRLNTGQMSVNMAREEDGADPVPWGDNPILPMNLAPYTGKSITLDDGEIATDTSALEAVPQSARDSGAAASVTAFSSKEGLNGAQMEAIVSTAHAVQTGAFPKQGAKDLFEFAYGMDQDLSESILATPENPQTTPSSPQTALSAVASATSPPTVSNTTDTESEGSERGELGGRAKVARLVRASSFDYRAQSEVDDLFHFELNDDDTIRAMGECSGERIVAMCFDEAQPTERAQLTFSELDQGLVYGRKWRNVLLHIFSAQRRSIREKLVAMDPHAEQRAEITVVHANDVFSATDVSLIFNESEWIRQFDELLALRGQVWTDAGQIALNGIIQDPPEFQMVTQSVANAQVHHARMVTRVNSTTRSRIATAVESSIADGLSYVDASKRITAQMGFRRRNVDTIARTEIGRAVSSGQMDGFRLGGVHRKRWNTARDRIVRDSHASIMGSTVVELEEPFILGDGEQADAPRIGFNGADLSAANVINCRCFPTPVVT